MVADELSHVLAQLRWQFGLERALTLGVRGLLLSGSALIVISGLVWVFEADQALTVLSAAPLIGVIGLMIVRWPSTRDAALAADRRLGLDDRLATSVELLRRPTSGRFDGLQLSDAVGSVRAAPRGWLALTPRFGIEAATALAVLLVGAATVLLLPSAPKPVGQPVVEEATSSDLSQQAELATPSVPDDALATTQPAGAQPLPVAQADAKLASRVQQEQAARTALDNLSKALRSISAGQGAADAIDNGDFTAARQQLQSLAEEADQLSDAAKQQLANALQEASAATAKADRQLADRERQAAQTLSRSSYADQRQALRNLADQAQRSGSRSVSADQLQHELGQLGQQSGGAGIDGQPGGPGVGSGQGPSPLGDDSSRLNTAGQTVQVPTRLANGPGVRPLDGSEDQLSTDRSLISRNVSEVSRAQLTGQIAPEQNLVPGEQRPVVRGYFR